MVIDVDGLKGVNDRLGHQQGDNLIRRVAAKLRERVRATDIVARLSGDEFAVLMPQSDVEGALQLGEDLRVQVADAFAGDPELAGATISVGITMFGAESDGGAEAVLAAADEAMYRAKAEGRNRVSLFETPVEAMRATPPRLTTSAEDPQRAHPEPSQPGDAADREPRRRRRSSASSCCCGCAARRGELLPASAFIGVAERSGMIQELDRWVVGQALDLLGDARAGRRSGLPPRQPLGRLADRHLGARVHRAAARRRRRRPGPLHLRDHPDRAGRGPRHGRRLRRPAHRVRLRSRDRRLRRRLRPLRVPEALPLRRDQDRRRLRPRPRPQRRRPAHREGDRRHRPGPRQDARSPSSSRTRRR